MSVSFVDGTAPARPPAQLLVAGSGLLALTLGAVYLGGDGWRQAALFIIGGLLGVSLYHAAFGFTSAYRKLFLSRDVAGVTAQLVMLAVAMVLFAPVL
ncbi:MAG: YeeE/YedE family protein, partial [Alphaproteobacteria bacterium]